MNTPTPNPTTRASLTCTAIHNARWFAGLFAGTAALGLPLAQAADIFWSGTTGSFESAVDWSTGTVPGPNDFAIIGNGGTVQITPATPQFTTQDFRTGGGGLTGSMEQSGSIANVTSWFRMGVDPGSTGTFTMSGGLLNIRSNRLNLGEKGTGTLELSGGLIYHGSGQLIAGNRDNGAESGPAAVGIINQSGGTFTNESEVWLGFGVNGDNTDFGTLNLTGGTFNVRRWFVMGRTGGEGVLNISGANTLLAKSGEDGHMILGDVAGGNNPKGTVNQNGGTVMIGSECWIGQSATANGIYNLNSGTILANNWFSSGRAGGTGVLNMTGGSITKTGGGSISVGGGGGASNGTVNHSAGLFNVVEGEVYAGENGSGIGTYNLSGTGELRVGNLIVSRSDTVDGVLNLDGGTARVARIFRNATDVAALGTANFNGSQIIATSHQAAFIAALTTADIKDGGLKLDTDTYNVATSQAFTGVGGIAKTGLGSLSVNTAFGATGPSTVSRGTLAINNGTFSSSSLTVSDGASLSGDNSTIAGTTDVAASGGVLLANSASALPIAFGGNVTLNGPTRIDFSNAIVAPGTYKVATFTGTLTDNGNLSLGRPGSVSLATPNEINVTVDPVRTLTWTGTAGPTWDIFSALNWDNTGSPAAFGQGDSVTLGDVATAAPISVTGPVRPAALTIDNTVGTTVTLLTGNTSAEITGVLPLVKQGAGKAILDIDATLGTGSTVNIAEGELQVGNGSTSGSLGVAPITNAGLLHFNLSRDRIFTNTITGSGTGSLIKSGAGTVTLTGALVNPGTTTVNAGRLVLSGDAKPTGTGIVIGGELEARISAGNHTYPGVVSGAGRLIKSGGNEFFLGGDNLAYAGEIEVRRGPTNSLNITHVNGLGSTAGKTVVHGLNGTGGQALNIRNLGGAGPFTIAEPIELRASAFGRASFTHEGGTQTLNFTGPIGVYSSGRSGVNIRNHNATATLNISGDISGEMGGAQLFVRGSTGPINITGSINIADDAEVVFTENVRVRLGAPGKTYTNFRTILAVGQVRTLVDNALPPQHPLFLGEGNNTVPSKLILGELTTPVVQTVTGIGSNNTNVDCRIVGGATTNSTFTMNLMGNSTVAAPFGGAGTDENNLNLVKSNVGTLTLGGASTYTGTTTLSGGTLLVNGSISASAVTAEPGTALGGSGTSGPLTAVGARIVPGNNGVGTLTVAGDASLGTDTGIDWQFTDYTGTAGSGFDLLNVTGALTLSATPANPLVIRIDDINLPLDNFAEVLQTFDIVTAASITGFDASAITLDDSLFTSGIGSWSISQVGNALRLTYSGTPYGNWIASKLLAGDDAGKDADPDGDGITNAIEFVLGTEPNPANPNSMSVADLPDQTLDATYLTVVYRRADISATALPVIEYGTDLTGWTTAVDSVDGVIITTVDDGIAAGIDEVTVKIPRGANITLFARLRSTVLP